MGITYMVCQCSGFLGIRFESTDDIDPVQGMEVIEMNDVVMLELGTMKKVSYNSRILRYFDTHGIFNCPHRGQCMGVCSDAAGALDKMLRITGIPASENEFNPPEHLG
jgi:hypothetical protein